MAVIPVMHANQSVGSALLKICVSLKIMLSDIVFLNDLNRALENHKLPNAHTLLLS